MYLGELAKGLGLGLGKTGCGGKFVDSSMGEVEGGELEFEDSLD